MNPLTLFALAFFLFLYAPLAAVVVYSFNAHPTNLLIWQGFTLDWYAGLLGLADGRADASGRAVYLESAPQLLAALRNSLVVAAAATTVSTVVGTAAALALRGWRSPKAAVCRGAVLLPMMMPDIVLGIGLLVVFSAARIPLGLATIVIGHCTFLTSYVVLIVGARLASMDPALEAASADLGAGGWTTFRKVTLPLLGPGIAGGALLAFIISMDDLVITYFIAGTGSQTLPVFIFAMVRRGLKPEINAAATLLILASVLIAGLGLRLRAHGARR